MKRNFAVRKNKGIESVLSEVRNIEKNVNTVAFLLDDGIVRVTPKDGDEWDAEDFASHFHLLGYPKYSLEPGDPHYPTRFQFGDVYQISWWDDDDKRSALVHKDLWYKVTTD